MMRQAHKEAYDGGRLPPSYLPFHTNAGSDPAQFPVIIGPGVTPRCLRGGGSGTVRISIFLLVSVAGAQAYPTSAGSIACVRSGVHYRGCREGWGAY
jgi:hypothetical protein